MIPGMIVGMPVAIVLAILLVMLVIVGDEIIEIEAVVGGDEVNTRPRLSFALVKEFARA